MRLALRRNYKGVPEWLIEQTLDAALLRSITGKWAEMAQKIPLEKA